MEMGKLLEFEIFPIKQFYRVGQSHLGDIKEILEERKVLPAYEGILRKFADDFVSLIKIRN